MSKLNPVAGWCKPPLFGQTPSIYAWQKFKLGALTHLCRLLPQVQPAVLQELKDTITEMEIAEAEADSVLEKCEFWRADLKDKFKDLQDSNASLQITCTEAQQQAAAAVERAAAAEQRAEEAEAASRAALAAAELQVLSLKISVEF